MVTAKVVLVMEETTRQFKRIFNMVLGRAPGGALKRSTSSLLRAHSRGSFSRLVFESETLAGGGGSERSLPFRLIQLFVSCYVQQAHWLAFPHAPSHIYRLLVFG